MIGLHRKPLAAALLLVAACGQTTPAGTAPALPASNAANDGLPAPGPARPVLIPDATERRLANGLRLIVVPRHASPLVTLELDVLAGSEVDPPGQSGLASFTAELLTQGTRSRSAPQIAEAAESLGGTLSAAADWDSSDISITVTTPKAEAAAQLLADVVRNPRFAKDDVERERAQALDGLRVSLAEPRTLATLAAARAAWGEAPYGHPRLGTPASITRLRPTDLAQLHARWYRPDQAVLLVTGDLDPEAAQALAERSFGDWQAEGPPPVRASTANAAPPPARLVVIDLPEAGQAAVVAVHRVPLRSTGDYYAGLVTNAVLGGGYSARLNEEIRIKRGLSYGAASHFTPRRDGGEWLASAQTKNSSAAEVLGLIRAELARLATETPPAAELAARRAALIGSFGRALETTSGLASQFELRTVLGIPLDEIRHTVANGEAVTADQVRDYAAQQLDATGTSFVIVGDARQFLDALKKLVGDSAGIEVIPATELDLELASLRARPRLVRTSAPAAPG